MEVPGGNNNKIVVCLSELIGTCFLLIAVNWGTCSGWTPICVGLTVYGMAQIFGPISGGHFNPAVSIGMYIKEIGKYTNNNGAMGNLVMLVLMIASQIVGAILGCVISALAMDMTPKTASALPAVPTIYPAQLCPATGCNDGGKMFGKVFWVEMFCTYLFVSVVLQIVKHNGSADMPVNALAIGLSLYTAIIIAGGITGGCINPAVGTVQPLFMKTFNDAVYPKVTTSLAYWPAYMFGPAAGGAMAGLFSRFVNEKGIERAAKAAVSF